MNDTLTEEQRKDVDTRSAEFLKRHEANMRELEIGFTSIPIPVQVSQGIWATQIQLMPIDTKYQAKPSPFANDKAL